MNFLSPLHLVTLILLSHPHLLQHAQRINQLPLFGDLVVGEAADDHVPNVDGFARGGNAGKFTSGMTDLERIPAPAAQPLQTGNLAAVGKHIADQHGE